VGLLHQARVVARAMVARAASARVVGEQAARAVVARAMVLWTRLDALQAEGVEVGWEGKGAAGQGQNRTEKGPGCGWPVAVNLCKQSCRVESAQ
jgi:hypothetical protein